ncbi:MAG: xylulokinase [Clostridia bacterium]|nr:xylulokinase [Clostridia bacterium]
MRYVIGIDLGTSGTKTVLFDEHGAVIASALVEYPMAQPQNGWAEQDPSDWWNAARDTIHTVVTESGVAAGDIVGVGISGQMHGLVMLDAENRVLRPSIIWCDQRTAEECRDIERRVGRERLIQITANPALTGFTASKIMWVKKHEPEIYKQCAHILLPKDYVRLMLTGVYATEVSDASGMQLLDIANRIWSQEVLEKLDIDIDLLGDVYESPEITGYITEEAAALTGLAVGTPVVGGAGDNAAAAIGTGTVHDGDAFTTIGTSGVVFAHTKDMVIDPDGRVHTFCCAVPGEWHVMGVTQGAGLSLRWFRDTFCRDIIATAEGIGKDPYVFMDEMAEKSGISARKLIFLPYLMGERTPHLDPNARGAFVGLSAIHDRGDMMRAIMEGVSYSLMDCLNVLDEMGVPVSKMLACGGGGSSSLWRQMLSDIYGMRISTVDSKEGPALGVAILAMVGAGIYPTVAEACEKVVRIKSTTEPSIKNNRKYAAVYERYRALYPHLKSDFTALHDMAFAEYDVTVSDEKLAEIEEKKEFNKGLKLLYKELDTNFAKLKRLDAIDAYLEEVFGMLDMFRGMQMNEKLLGHGKKEFFEPEKVYGFVKMSRNAIKEYI